MNTDQLTRDLLRQEQARLRARAAFFHSCADTIEHTATSREASRRVASKLGELIGRLADDLDKRE